MTRELHVGSRFGGVRALSYSDLDTAVNLTGGIHPVHTDEAKAREAGFPGRVFHGAVCAAIMVAEVGKYFIEDKIAILKQESRYLAPVLPGDVVTIDWTIEKLQPFKQGVTVTLFGRMHSQGNRSVLDSTVVLRRLA
jgi:3-hydroxybutyryl-CoA dehydratase